MMMTHSKRLKTATPHSRLSSRKLQMLIRILVRGVPPSHRDRHSGAANHPMIVLYLSCAINGSFCDTQFCFVVEDIIFSDLYYLGYSET